MANNLMLMYFVLMLTGGILGGTINHLLDRENQLRKKETATGGYRFDDDLKKSVIIGIGAALLVPLFLKTIQSRLLNFNEINHEHIFVFLGFCIVASISSRKFISTISDRLLKTIQIETEGLVSKTVDEKMSIKEAESARNAEALYLVDKVLDDNPDIEEELPEDKEVIKAIQLSSLNIRKNIFRLARNYRTKHTKTSSKLIYRTIPIFRGLMKSDKENKYHRNYAQLAYVFMEKNENEYYENAKDLLSEAIEIRNKTVNNNFKTYEFKRAICRIKLDSEFQDKTLSTAKNKAEILEDLRIAMAQNKISILINVLLSENEAQPEDPNSKLLKEWFTLNKILTTDLHP